MKTRVPWPLKIAAKIALSRLPVSRRLWRRVGLFAHGAMDQPEYAYVTFRRHFDRAGFPRRAGGFVALELGPGDSLFSALIARAFGAAGSYLVDVGDFARRDMEPYRAMAAYLAEQGLEAPDVARFHSVAELLAACGAQYLTGGLASLRAIPDQAVDFIWSQAVLEHIRRADFFDTLCELRRVLRDDGVGSHRVDLKDHLGGALNHLRFSERVWESGWMAGSGFYTNRLRYSEMLRWFEQAGFAVEVISVDRWDRLPTPRARLATGFREWSDEELCVAGFDVVLRPTGAR